MDGYKLETYDKFKGYLKNLSHAYIFVNNGDVNFENIVYYFAALITNNFNNDDNIDIIIRSIKENTHTEIRQIKPEGLWIKKEQLVDLKNEFKSKSLNSSKKIYIIKEIEKLNKYSANSILKFLEEPEEDIIAILTTNNINSVYSTIVSRCQKIILPNQGNKTDYILNLFSEKNFSNLNIDKNNIEEFVNSVINFIYLYEENGINVICYSKDSFYKTYNKREELEVSFQIMILFYKDILYYLRNKSIYVFSNYEEFIKKIAEFNNQSDIINKIKVLMQKKDLIKYNINVNLLFDSLVLEFEGEYI
ncbi:MAG: AAA family ATPase [Tenericutes bacterium]|nr:AAA family ATPase [Mycoplasmatota bacterium]